MFGKKDVCEIFLFMSDSTDYGLLMFSCGVLLLLSWDPCLYRHATEEKMHWLHMILKNKLIFDS